MSIIDKLITKKAAPDQQAIRREAIDKIGAAIDSAIDAGVPVHAVIDCLERHENAARHRMAAGLRF